MTFRRKNKYSLLLALLVLSTFGLAQKNKPVFQYDIKYFFNENMTASTRIVIWAHKNDIKKDSSFSYNILEKKVSVSFKFKCFKGACDIILTDTLNNLIIKGRFSNGLALLCDQNEAFTSDGSEIIVLERFYKGIPEGKWIYTDLTGNLIKEVVYHSKRSK